MRVLQIFIPLFTEHIHRLKGSGIGLHPESLEVLLQFPRHSYPVSDISNPVVNFNRTSERLRSDIEASSSSMTRCIRLEELLPLSRFLEIPLLRTVRVNGRSYPNLLATIHSSRLSRRDYHYGSSMQSEEHCLTGS